MPSKPKEPKKPTRKARPQTRSAKFGPFNRTFEEAIDKALNKQRAARGWPK